MFFFLKKERNKKNGIQVLVSSLFFSLNILTLCISYLYLWLEYFLTSFFHSKKPIQTLHSKKTKKIKKVHIQLMDQGAIRVPIRKEKKEQRFSCLKKEIHCLNTHKGIRDKKGGAFGRQIPLLKRHHCLLSHRNLFLLPTEL